MAMLIYPSQMLFLLSNVDTPPSRGGICYPEQRTRVTSKLEINRVMIQEHKGLNTKE